MAEKELKRRIVFYDQIAKNKRQSFFLIIAIFLVFLLFGYIISLAVDPGFFFIIMIISIIISISYIVIGYYKSDKIALASVKAKRADKIKYRQLYHAVEGLTIASGLPMPKVYIMENNQINAFASGRDPQHAIICVTTGAIEKLDKQELEGVIGHELSHIANYDIRFMTLAAILVGMIAIASEIFLRSLWFGGGRGRRDDKAGVIFLILGISMAIIAPILVKLVQLTISRKREFSADATAVKLTRYPPGLTRALKKIKYETGMKKGQVPGAVAPLFFANPFKKDAMKNLRSTHPPIDKRIEVLERM